MATQILTGLALLATLQFHLLASFLAGLLVYQLVHLLAPNRYSTVVQDHTAKVIAVAFLAVVVSAIAAAILGLIAVLSSGSDNLSLLLRKMAEVIESVRSQLPPWILSFVPDESEELRATSVAWLREHAGRLRYGCVRSARMSGEFCSTPSSASSSGEWSPSAARSGQRSGGHSSRRFRSGFA